MKRFNYKLLIIMTALLALTGCGSGNTGPQDTAESSVASVAEVSEEAVDSVEAAAMRLVKIIGNVSLTDETGANPPAQEDMRLFSGFAIDTETESKAGIALDDVKAATVGAESRTELTQDGKYLAMNLIKGEMYFSVLKPLEEDERFEISTGNMTMGIRGTSGYVAVVDDDTSLVILTSGHAMITSSGGEEQDIEAGQRVVVYTGGEGTSFDAAPVDPADYPQLLIEELSADTQMLAQVDEQNDGDYTNLLAAMEQYRAIMAQAASYDYGLSDGMSYTDIVPTGEYQYALVYVNDTDTVPTLLLRQDTNNQIFDRVRLFRYSPESGTVIDPGYTLASTMNSEIHVFTVYAADNGNGLMLYEDYSGNGRFFDLNRLVFNGEEMSVTHVYDGDIVGGFPPEEFAYHDIQWNNINSAGSLSTLTMPTDGDRIVLSGTINTFSLAEAVELQGMPDWNGTDPSYTFRIIVLDEPRNLLCQSIDTPYVNTARMIYVEGAGIPTEYDGQHIIFSVDSATMWWPSDTRIPIGQPGTSDVHILR